MVQAGHRSGTGGVLGGYWKGAVQKGYRRVQSCLPLFFFQSISPFSGKRISYLLGGYLNCQVTKSV